MEVTSLNELHSMGWVRPIMHRIMKPLGAVIDYKWKNHFFKMKGGYRDGLKHQKGRNKGSLHSKDAQSYMTPSLYLCSIFNFDYKQ